MNETQIKYLSPREILNILCRLEESVPHSPAPYKPLITSSPITLEQLNAEAQKMLHYVGLFNYNPICDFDLKADNAGGQIKLVEGQYSGDLYISFKNRLKNSVPEVLAVMAHEICHKRLADSFISFPHTDDGIKQCEYHTDICTIYVGFGKLILDGYNYEGNAMGYLKPNM